VPRTEVSPEPLPPLEVQAFHSRHILPYMVWIFLLVGLPACMRAQEVIVPAGTLIHCTLEEPNLSSKTVAQGDPILCHLSSLQQFGRIVFPRGTYLQGREEDSKEPGNFFGKGSIRLVFDRIGLPNAEGPIYSKVIAVRGYPVNRDGDILGKGHAKRDAAEWLFPILWPWKVLTLPARGPRPTLKGGEEPVTLRVMEDIVLPSSAQTLGPGWHHFDFFSQAR
jgi:hypothetical protein